MQGRIQDFEMGGEFCNNVREIKYYFNIWGIRKKKKKKKEGGSEKEGWKSTHFTFPGSAPEMASFRLRQSGQRPAGFRGYRLVCHFFVLTIF